MTHKAKPVSDSQEQSVAGVLGKGLVSEYWAFQEPLLLCRNCSLLPLSSKQPQLHQEMGSNNATVLSSDITHVWSASEGRYCHTQRPQILVCHAPAAVTIGCDGFQMTSTREKYPTHFSLHERLYPLSPEASTPNGQWVQWYKKCPFCLMGVCLVLYSICHKIKTSKLYLVTRYLLRVNPGFLQSTME